MVWIPLPWRLSAGFLRDDQGDVCGRSSARAVPGLAWLPRSKAWQERACESDLGRAPWKTARTREWERTVPNRDFSSGDSRCQLSGSANTLGGRHKKLDLGRGEQSTGRAGSGPSQRLSEEFSEAGVAPGQCFPHVKPCSKLASFRSPDTNSLHLALVGPITPKEKLGHQHLSARNVQRIKLHPGMEILQKVPTCFPSGWSSGLRRIWVDS